MDATQPTTAQLVQAIEAGWDTAKEVSNRLEGWAFTPFEILSAETAFATYRQRMEALEAANRKLMAFVEWFANDPTFAEYGGFFAEEKARALLQELKG